MKGVPEICVRTVCVSVRGNLNTKAMGAYACSKASRRPDKNAGSVFEQRKALARLRAHLRDVVRNRPR
ncbi:hypothetical protein PagCFBP13532_17020 [Pantoea agglomerans]|nr:hypothetical protein PagCFBP13505_09690 [Pantoea agglomerans]TKK21352.1 hypothetical protein PagCFBP13516_06725 [Pantoea agglomerans]TKK30682.1 hypothetical protein PagCFBP13532_17020 [Pantoea agglomerans]